MRKSPNLNLIFGCTLTGVVLAVIAVGFFWTPYDPNAIDGAAKSLGPCAGHIFGTDNMGRDVFSRVMEGSRTTMEIAFLAVLIGASFGTVIGGLTGYFVGNSAEIARQPADNRAKACTN